MKKYILLLICALMGVTTFAQQEPNRMLITNKLGNITPFRIDNVDSIYFTTVEGRVAADVEVKEVYIKNETEGIKDMVVIGVKRTEACAAYKIACLKKSMADKIDSDNMAEYYFNLNDHSLYYQDFENAQMTGFEFAFSPNTEYYILTLGYDQYGTPCEMQKVAFTTPNIPLVGSPSVGYEEISVTSDVITFAFKPNADVKGFAATIFKKGEAENQFTTWGGFMGFTCMGDMIKAFGYQGASNDTTFTWTSMEPNTEYEIYVQCWDVNGTFADMIIIPITTKKLGGEGTAEVAIEIKETKYWEAYDQFTQRVVFTPNENVSLYRASLFDYSFLEEHGTEGIMEYLKADMKDNPYWNLYKTDDDFWKLEPNKKFVAAAIGQNINGEWGPLNVKEFVTPANADIVEPANTYAPLMNNVAPMKGTAARFANKENIKKGVIPDNLSLQIKACSLLTNKSTPLIIR